MCFYCSCVGTNTNKCIAGKGADASSNIDCIDYWLTIPPTIVEASFLIGSSSHPVAFANVTTLWPSSGKRPEVPGVKNLRIFLHTSLGVIKNNIWLSGTATEFEMFRDWDIPGIKKENSESWHNFVFAWILTIICDEIRQKVHKVGKQNFTGEAFMENEVKMIKVVFLPKIVGRDI